MIEIPESEKLYTKNCAEAEARMKPMLTDEVLATMLEAARVVGWGVDFIESAEFVRACYTIAGKERPVFECIEYEKGST